MMTARHLRWVLAGVTVVVWAALLRLTMAFLHNEFGWRTVAMYSRFDAPWYYRLSGVWGGLEGSLLLFTAFVATGALVACRRATSRAVVGYAVAAVIAFAALDLILANPFRRLDIPAIGGFGLTPILEHPAMAVHPPLLYAGLSCALVPMLHAIDGTCSTTRGWLRLSLALVTIAMALGAVWSYIEQGWGGYWAWDPVENTSLLVWCAVLIALHSERWWAVDGPRRMLVLAGPWVMVLVGATIVRSGSTPSIHGFGQRAALGWWLLAATVATVVFVVVIVRSARSRTEDGAVVAGLGDSAMSVRITALVAVVVLAGTLAPVVVDLLADRPAAVRGRFYAAFVGPAALVAVPFLILRLRRGLATGWLAHGGMLVLLVGVAASTFDRADTVIIAPGQTVSAAGVDVTNLGVRVVDGPRIESTAVVADLVVDGHRLSPRRIAFFDRGGQLAENEIITRPWRDVQVQLDTANDSEVVTVTVYNRPLMWLVWIGVVLVAAGALLSRGGRRRHRRVTDRGPVPDALACEPTSR